MSARRRLLRGSFAAPAVLALQSGSAIAATSALRCIANQVASPTTQPVVTYNDGTWLRLQLWAFVNNSNNTVYQGEYWIRGSDLSAYVVNGQTPFLGATQYQKFNIGTNLLGTVSSTQPVAGMGFTWQAVNQFVSLRVSATGAIVGAGSSMEGSAVSGTCWNSFKLGA